MPIFNNMLAGASGGAGGAGGAGYEIERSLRFNSADSAYLNRTPSAAGNRKTWTWSAWIKRSLLGTAQYLFYCEISSSNFAALYFTGSDTNKLTSYLDGTTGGAVTKTTDAVFIDCSAWYHVVWSVDSTQATAADRVKIYVNGVLQTTTGSDISQNDEFPINSTTNHGIGARTSNNTSLLDAYLADVHLIDGQALAPTDFGETDDNGVWQPKEFAGSYAPVAGDYSISGGSNYLNREPADMFDGSTSTYWQAAASGDRYQLMTFPTPKTGTTIELSVLAANGWDGFEINGTVPSSLPSAGSQSWYDISSHTSSSLSSIRIAYTSGVQTQLVYALRIDGTIVTGQTEGASVSNSFHLDFADNSSNAALGTDTSGNNNTWTVNNINAVSGALTKSVGDNYLTGLASTYITSGTISQDTGQTLPYTAAHYGGSTFRANTGGAKITTTNSAYQEFFMSAWLKFDGQESKQMGVDLSGGYIYWESLSNGKIKIRHEGGSGVESQSAVLTTGWHHCALSRSGNRLYGFVDGNVVVDTTSGVPSSGNSVNQNENWWLFYNPYGRAFRMLDVAIFAGVGVGSNFTAPTAPMFSSTEDITNPAGLANTYRIYASPMIQVGSSADNIDSLVDTPTNGTQTDTGVGNEVVGNYATLNPLIEAANSATYSNGNLDASSSTFAWHIFRASIGVTSGKWLAEYTTTGNNMFGIDANIANAGRAYFNESAGNITVRTNGTTLIDNVNQGTTGSSISDGSIVGLALDLDSSTKTLKVYINGSLDQTINLTSNFNSTEVFFAGALYSTATISFNCGQRAFAYPVSGYKSLNTANLPTPTIADGSQYFDTKLYTGTGSAQSIGGFGFSPDLVWYKSRSNSLWHGIYDIVRGVNKGLFPNATQAETTYAAVTGFNSDGFTIGTVGDVNTNSATYAAWAWDAGSSNTTIAAGGLNSSLYNQAEAWNSQVTGTSQSYDFGGGGLRGDNNWFDGDIKHASSALSGNTITWTGSIAFTSSFAIASDNDGADSSVTAPYNAVNITHGPSNTITNVRSQLPNTANSQLAAGTIPLTVLTGITSPVTKIECVGGTQGANGLTQVVADGRMLVDSGITLANVPSIASTVRANPTAGFSIVSYNTSNNYPTIGHGLNTEVEFIIAKSKTDGNAPWVVYTKTGGLDNYLMLNSTAASGGLSGAWGTSAFTSSTFSAGWNDYYSNRDNMIAYCFAPVAGYSAMGSYVGNGSADGPFVYTGFRPGWLMVKNASTSGETWTIYDAARDPHNLATNRLQPNASDAETSGTAARDKDFLSNGFKVRGTSGEQNTNGDTYIYLAFASNPFKTARAR
jgi:hypothetical protein